MYAFTTSMWILVFFFSSHLFPASMTSDPCDVPWSVFGLFDQSLQLLHVAQQRVGQLLQVQPGVLLGFADHWGRPANGTHLQAGHECVWRRHPPGHLGMNRLRRHGQRRQGGKHCRREGVSQPVSAGPLTRMCRPSSTAVTCCAGEHLALCRAVWNNGSGSSSGGGVACWTTVKGQGTRGGKLSWRRHCDCWRIADVLKHSW